jgi:hypothetical protein
MFKCVYRGGCRTRCFLHLRLRWTRRGSGTRPNDLYEKTNVVGCLHCKKTRITTFKNKSQITNAYLSPYVRAGVLLLVICIYVCVGRDEELAHVHVTFIRRPMQWGISTKKKTGIKTLKTNTKSRTHVQMRV